MRLILPDVLGCGDTIDRLIGLIVERWGGVTSWMASGRWNGTVEDVCVVECSVGPRTTSTQKWWIDLAKDARLSLDQKCIYLSVREESALLIGLDSTKVIGD